MRHSVHCILFATANLVSTLATVSAAGGVDSHEASRQSPTESTRQQASIRRIIAKVIDKQRLIGTQAAVWHDGKMIFDAAWGEADSGLQVPVSASTRFYLASIAKTMTGLAALRLEKEGRVDLDAAIQTYVPDFPQNSGAPLTPRLLLTHRSGIRHYNPTELTGATFFDKHYSTAKQALEKFARDPLIAEPGSKEKYSSYAYTLLAAAIEQVVGVPFQDHLRQTIFEPFGMRRSEVPDWRYPVDELATSYGYFLRHLGQSADRPFQARRLNFSYNAGAGNVVSNARDLVEYGRHFLEGGSVGADLTSKITDVDSVPGQSYGWFITRDTAQRMVMHATGASEAYQGSITVWPKHGLVVVALSNTWGIGSLRGGFTLEMHQRIADVILGG